MTIALHVEPKRLFTKRDNKFSLAIRSLDYNANLSQKYWLYK